MTDAAPHTEHHKRRKHGGGKYFITDTELIERLAVPEKVAREAFRALDSNPRSGFPKKQELWGDRRYWPAVKAYLKANYGILQGDAARSAAESLDRTRLPHHSPLRSRVAERQDHEH